MWPHNLVPMLNLTPFNRGKNDRTKVPKMYPRIRGHRILSSSAVDYLQTNVQPRFKLKFHLNAFLTFATKTKNGIIIICTNAVARKLPSKKQYDAVAPVLLVRPQVWTSGHRVCGATRVNPLNGRPVLIRRRRSRWRGRS